MYIKVKNLFIIFFSFMICFTAFPINSYAKNTVNKVVRVGYYSNELFEEGAYDGAVKNGYAYEYYRKLSEYTGWSYEYVYGDFADVYQMLLDGEVDLVAGLAKNEEREQIISYPERTMGYEYYGLVKHEDDDSINSNPSTLNDRTIGVLESALADSLYLFLDEHDIDAKVITYKNYDTLLSAFDKKEVDVLATEYEGTYDRNHAQTLYTYGEADYYLAVNIDRPDLLKELNQAQEQLFIEEPGYISLLRNKYYAGSLSSKAFTLEEREWIRENTSIKVGYLNDFLPYSDTDNEGNVTGIVKDVVPALFNNLGVKNLQINYVGYDSYEEIVDAISDNTIDMAFPVGGGLFYSEEDGVYLSNQVISSYANLIYSDKYMGTSSSDFAVNGLNKIQYYYIISHYSDYSISSYDSINKCLDAVVDGKVSYTVLDGLRTNGILKQYRYRDLDFRQLGYADEKSFGVKIGNEALLKLLNRGINILGQDYILNLAYNYTDELYTYTFKDFVRNHLMLISIIFAIIGMLVFLILIRESINKSKRLNEKEKDRLALENSNRQKIIFLKNMTHDLRHPINSMNGLIDLSKHTEDMKLRDEYLDTMSRYSDQLLSVINDVLDFSRLESGQVHLDEQNVNLHDVINDVRAVTSSAVIEKQHIINVDLKNVNHVNIITDKMRLTQVILNIFSNAVYFTPPNGMIDLIVSEEESVSDKIKLKFEIRDNGIGMSPKLVSSIFDPYNEDKSTIEGGSEIQGFGMAITKQIVDKMQGEIFVNSVEGEGTSFVFEIPFKMSESTGDSYKIYDHETLNAYDFYGKRIMIVEDTVPNQQITGRIMKKVGFEIQIANDAFEAYEKMNAAPSGYFDIILLDINLSDQTNINALRNIRELMDPVKANIPIVASTENQPDIIEVTRFEDIISGYVIKPYELPKMMETLSGLLK